MRKIPEAKQLADIIRSVLTNLPRKTIAKGDMAGKFSSGDIEVHLVIRFEDVDRFEVAYLSKRGDFIRLDEKEPCWVDSYDHAVLVGDFARKFGWTDEVQKLTEEQEKEADMIAQSVLTVFSVCPFSIHSRIVGGVPVFSLDERDDSEAFFLTVDVGMFNERITWVAVYVVNVRGIMLDATNVKFEPADPERLKRKMREIFLLDLNKKKRKKKAVSGPFSVAFLRDKDMPMVPENLGISDERVSEFFTQFKVLSDEKKDMESVFEELSSMCRSSSELFFIGWMLGSINMKEFMDEDGPDLFFIKETEP